MMRKNITNIGIVLFLLAAINTVYAQKKDYGAEPEKCAQYLSLFHESVKSKNYTDAYEYWLWCFDNCPKGSKLIYSDGLKIAKDKFEKGEKDEAGKLIDEIYKRRILNFPSNLGKVYSDWAISLQKRGASKELIFEKLEAGFKADPSGLSIKNMALFFQEVTNRNKDTNVQKVFDTYDDVLEAVNVKIAKLSKELDIINAKDSTGQSLSPKEKRKRRNNGINLKGLGQVEDALDQIISEVATCDRLIPLYKKGLETHKTDSKWLRRAASRMNGKECTSDPLYPKLVEAYVHADPSPKAYIYYAGLLEDRGQVNKAIEYRKKAVDLEPDSYKKAQYLLNIAYTMRKRSKSQARTYANRALRERPSFGAAYLFIANLYGSSANSCGTDEFSKRMVYIAAANKALQAKRVDPSLSARANHAYKAYMANSPSKKMIFNSDYKPGRPFKIGCWIGETVRIP